RWCGALCCRLVCVIRHVTDVHVVPRLQWRHGVVLPHFILLEAGSDSGGAPAPLGHTSIPEK
ncbi:MAG TPA: hypothetical protein ACQGQI_01310, partial [Xylella sp.]